MVTPRRPAVPLATLALLCALTHAPVAAEDLLEQSAATARFRLGAPARPQVSDDGRLVAFLRSGPRTFAQDLWVWDRETGAARLVARADELSGAGVDAEELARRERQRIVARGITSFELVGDGQRALVPVDGRLWLVDLAGGGARELPAAAGAIDPRPSPDGRRVAFSRDDEVWVVDAVSGEGRALTADAPDGVVRGQPEFVVQEEFDRKHGLWWSPDGTRLLMQESDDRAVETLYRMDPTEPARPPLAARYPRAGTTNATVRLALIDAGGGEPVPVEPDAPWEYIVSVVWSAGAPPTLVTMNRRQTERRVLTVDVATGAARTIHVETSSAWIEHDPAMPVWVGPDRFLWTTEQRGAPQVELRAGDGALVAELTPPEPRLQQVQGWNREARALVVRRSADTARATVVALPLEGDRFGTPVPLGAGRGPDSLASADRGASRVVVVAERPPDGPRAWRVVDAGTGRALGELPSVAEEPARAPRVEYVTVGDDPAFRAAIVRPADFDPALRYPTLVHVYGGPTSVMVRADRREWVIDQWLADAGFIVVAIDGRGTPGRGRAWLTAVRGDLISVPLADQAAGLRALARREPAIDLGRVGIYGWSFGGYVSAMAAIRDPDTFHAAVAGAPVTDWRDYDTAYTERYLGVPGDIEGAYEGTSAVAEVAGLRRPVLLIHGTDDDNVYFVHAARLADAAFRAGAPVEFVPLVGFTHMVPEPEVTIGMYGRILAHFERQLGDPAPAPPAE